MRDYRDAKTMAQTLRESLSTKSITVSHSESLELVAKMLGVSDWNTLSALLQADRRETTISPLKRPAGAVNYPAVPLRDLVPFPNTSYPLFVGREKTMQALDQAFQGHREVVLVVQRDAALDEPGLEDVYDIGVLARVLELERMSDRTLKVLTQIYRRVAIRRFIVDKGAFQAEIADIAEGPIPEAPFLIHRAAARFETYAAAHAIQVRQIWPPLDKARDPGRVADIIAAHMVLPIADKQNLLATLDPVARLERVDAALEQVIPNAKSMGPR